MIGYRVSKTGLAKRPFPVSHVGIGLWSVEELCVYVTENPALVDETLLNEALTRWLAEEFRLTDVALKMERLIHSQAKSADILQPLLRGTGYLDPHEQRRFAGIMERMNSGGVCVRLKMKGDALTRNRRYGEAVSVYEQAAELAPGPDTAFRASVHHNRGAALMQMLLYEEAVSAFREALFLDRTRDRMRTLLLALMVAKPSSSLPSEAAELGADDDLVKEVNALYDNAVTLPLDVPEDLSGELDRIRLSYHREAGT